MIDRFYVILNTIIRFEWQITSHIIVLVEFFFNFWQYDATPRKLLNIKNLTDSVSGASMQIINNLSNNKYSI